MRRAQIATAILPLILSLAAAVVLVVLPCFQMSESRSTAAGGESQGRVVIERQCRSLLEATDYRVLYLLLVPVILAALYLFSALRHWKLAGTLLTVLLGIFVLLTGFSIGLFFAPAALAGAISLALLLSSSSHSTNGIPNE
jgi:hypothetical protein